MGKAYCSLSCSTRMQSYKRKLTRLIDYLGAPVFCANIECGIELPWGQRMNKYCSRSCSAHHTQLGGPGRHHTREFHPCEACGRATRNPKYCSRECARMHVVVLRPPKPEIACEQCGELTTNPRYCSNPCFQVARRASKDAEIESCPEGVAVGTLRRYMLRRYSSCAICSISTWRDSPVPLVMDHIDGNPTNDALDNLRLICPNCDAQLPTFKSRNRGNGRAWRRERYRAGKSY